MNLEESTKNIIGRRGETLDFDFSVSDTAIPSFVNASFHFLVRKNILDNAETPIIHKILSNIVIANGNATVKLFLTNADTSIFENVSSGYAEYQWGLILKDGDGNNHNCTIVSGDNIPKVIGYPSLRITTFSEVPA